MGIQENMVVKNTLIRTYFRRESGIGGTKILMIFGKDGDCDANLHKT